MATARRSKKVRSTVFDTAHGSDAEVAALIEFLFKHALGSESAIEVARRLVQEAAAGKDAVELLNQFERDARLGPQSWKMARKRLLPTKTAMFTAEVCMHGGHPWVCSLCKG